MVAVEGAADVSGLYTDRYVESIRRSLTAIVGLWGLSPATTVTLLNISENATFRADDPASDAPIVLRVHRRGYHTRAEIASELAWIDALRTDAVAPIAAPLRLTTGDHIATMTVGEETREVVGFAFMAGDEPSPQDDLVDGFRELGAISARFHRHASGWKRPGWFTRKTWDVAATVGRSAYWGDWRAALGLTAPGAAVLERVVTVLDRRLSAFGDGPDRFGLIHADLRLANLLIDGDQIGVIDFDDCGFGWFMFDFAAAISFFETDATIPALQAAWVDGYRAAAPLSDEAERELPTFIMLRRLQLTAWIASHRETPTAQELGGPFTDGTLDIADGYLSRFA